MKKLLMFVLCAAMLLSLAACAAPSAPVAGDNAVGGTASRPAPNYEIDALYALEGEYTDNAGNIYVYSYHVPQFAEITKETKELNQKIEAFFGAMVEKELDNMENGRELTVVSVDWSGSAGGSGSAMKLEIRAHNGNGGTDIVRCAYAALAEKILYYRTSSENGGVYGETAAAPETPAVQTPAPNTEITELYALDGEYADSFDNRYLYSYHVPQFADDSEDAAEMNREIAQVFGTMVEDELLTMEQDCSLITLSIEWDAYYYRDHIVFLVITAENDWGGSEHMVCVYDAAARDDLDFEDIAALAGYSEDALLAAIRAAAEASFAASFGPNKDMFGEQYYNEMRDWTLSEENINDDTMVYLDDDGHIYAIVAIAAPAGAGWYYNTMKIA